MIYLMAACWKIAGKMLSFLLHMKKLIKQLACKHPVATDSLFLKNCHTVYELRTVTLILKAVIVCCV